MLLQYKSLLKLGNQTFQSKRQVGVRDYTGDPPPSHEEYNTAPAGYHGPTIFAPASPPVPPPKLPLQTVSPVPIVTSASSAPASVAPTTAPMEASSPKPASAKKRDLSRTPPKRASAAVQPAETEQLREGAPRGPAEATAVPDSETEEVSLRQERKAPKRKSRAKARGATLPRAKPVPSASPETSPVPSDFESAKEDVEDEPWQDVPGGDQAPMTPTPVASPDDIENDLEDYDDDLARVMHELEHGEELPQRQPVAPAPKGEDFARRRRELDGVELLPQQPV